MKKQPLSLISAITIIFLAFTVGFFLGRNQNHEIIQISACFPVQHHVPTETATAISEARTNTSQIQHAVEFPVDINTAGIEALTQLPGIGETLAQRIISYRDQHGPFERPEELMNVDGIGSGKLEAILDYIAAGG